MDKIVNIQNKFRLHYLLKKINSIQFKKLIDTKDFDILNKILSDKLLFNDIKNALNYLFIYFDKYVLYTTSNYFNLKKKTKIFITCFILCNSKEIVISHNTEYNDILYNTARNIVTIINNIIINNKNSSNLYNIIKLNNLIHKYITLYSTWSFLDKRIYVNEFLLEYYKNIVLSKKLDSDNNFHNILLNKINRDQKDIIDNVTYLNDKNSINYFVMYKDNIEYSDKIHMELFWINVKYELSKKDFNIEIIIKLINKTKILLKECVKGSKNIHEEIDKVLDIELLNQYLENNIFDNAHFYKLMMYIIDKIGDYQAVIDDDSLYRFKHTIDSKIKNNALYKDLIPYFFKNVFDRLQKIIVDKNNFIKLFIKNKK